MDNDQAVVPLHLEATGKLNLCSIALTIRYKGDERLVDIPLDRSLLGLFALEAEFQSMNIGNLISQILCSIAKNDMFALVLERARSEARLGAPLGD